MTDQELKRLNRAELLEMLVAQSELCDELQKKSDDLQKKLEERRIDLDSSGTMAEAAMKLSGIFEAADKASKLYVENIERMSREMEEACKSKLAEAETEAQRIIADAERQRDLILQKAKEIIRNNLKAAAGDVSRRKPDDAGDADK